MNVQNEKTDAVREGSKVVAKINGNPVSLLCIFSTDSYSYIHFLRYIDHKTIREYIPLKSGIRYEEGQMVFPENVETREIINEGSLGKIFFKQDADRLKIKGLWR